MERKMVTHSLHRLDEAKAGKQQVTVELQNLHGLHQVVLPDDVLHPDSSSLILTC